MRLLVPALVQRDQPLHVRGHLDPRPQRGPQVQQRRLAQLLVELAPLRLRSSSLLMRRVSSSARRKSSPERPPQRVLELRRRVPRRERLLQVLARRSGSPSARYPRPSA